jgi:hypothetical protein
MSKRFFAAAFATGLAAIAWIAYGFIGSNWLALSITSVIAGVYLLGAFELRQFRSGTAALGKALDDLTEAPATLGAWLDGVPSNLRQAVRLRVEGERGGLPGPALTPYLVGLLVMLGMLGTFLGMVVTFNGAVFALERSADLQAMRSALAEPIRGLGLSFGTSVAGVAASAMLGLMSALSRRERLEVGRQLDQRVVTVLLPFSLVHQRQETFKAVQAQARALPDVVDKLDALIERMETRTQQLDAGLLRRQAEFQGEATRAYAELARSVGVSLQESLAGSARVAGETIRPAVESAMAQVTQDAQRMHARLGELAQQQVDGLAREFSGTTQAVLDSLARAQSEHAALEQDRVKAHAGVIAQLREETGRVSARENAALQERTALLEQLGALLRRVDAAASEQAGKAAEMATQATAGAVQLTGVAQAFGDSVRAFQESNDRMLQALQRIEGSLERSTARSDEQLAYYVAQAREVIDLSIASQEGVIENLRQLQGKPVKPVALAAGGRG